MTADEHIAPILRTKYCQLLYEQITLIIVILIVLICSYPEVNSERTILYEISIIVWYIQLELEVSTRSKYISFIYRDEFYKHELRYINILSVLGKTCVGNINI